VTPDKLLERRFARLSLTVGESLQKLAIAGPGHDPKLKQSINFSVNHVRLGTRPNTLGLVEPHC
jgi:hypothetical protein